MTHTISSTAAQAGVSPDTLRYYERVGLLDPPERTRAGYRVYDSGATDRVRFIKGAQRMGLRLKDIKELPDIRDRGACPCGHTRTVLQHRITEIDDELRRLNALRREMSVMLTGIEECREPQPGAWPCETEFTKKGGDPR